MKKIHLEKNTLTVINNFIEKYGENTLISALSDYDISKQVYICQTKSTIKKVPLCSIRYIEIFGHHIIIHTDNGPFQKYGTLKNEYVYAKTRGFIKCNQSILVPVSKISEIVGNELFLITGERFTLSRSCATNVISIYMKQR